MKSRYLKWDYSPSLEHISIMLSHPQVLDDKNVRRRFRASNYQSTTRVKPFICTMPMRLDDGWNQIQFNLADFTRRAYGTNYIETLRVQVRAFSPLHSCMEKFSYLSLLACRSMPTVVFVVSTSRIVCIRKTSFLQNLSSIYLCRTRPIPRYARHCH